MQEWYAVCTDEKNYVLVNGSNDYNEAVAMAKEVDAHVIVIFEDISEPIPIGIEYM